MKTRAYCPNMNHARIMVSIQYCPTCGEKFNVVCESPRCTDTHHDRKRKDRDGFCCDCGLRLSATLKKKLEWP